MSSRLQHERRIHLKGVSPHARPWVAACLARALAEQNQKNLLWLLADERQAEEAAAAARFYLGATAPDPADPFAARVAHFPLHQLSPYDDLSPDPDATAERLALLFRLVHASSPALVIASAPSLMRLVPSRETIDSASQLILVGQELDQADLARQLVRSGYLNVPLVEEPGGFSVRGFIMDIFTPQLPQPVRLEWFGDEVESIRTFDPTSQRTKATLDEVFIGPAREILADERSTTRALEAVERRAVELDLASHKLLGLRRNLEGGIRFFGIESLLPAFHPDLVSFFDYLPDQTRILLDDQGGVLAAAHQNWERVNAACEETIKAGDLAFDPEDMLLSPERLARCIEASPGLTVGPAEHTDAVFEVSCQDVGGLREQIQKTPADGDPLQPFTDALKTWHREGVRTFVAAARPGRARQLTRMLQSRGLAVRSEKQSFDLDWLDQHTPNLFARIAPGDLPSGFGGFVCKAVGVAIVPDAEVFGRPARKIRTARPSREVLSLETGQLIVHLDFGIGRFDGLVKLSVGGSEADFLHLTYRHGDKLYLPVTRMNLIERYTGPEGARPPLTRLGGKSWERSKQKVKQALLEMADGLVRLEATRRSQPGVAADSPGEEFASLQASFAFEETPDQQRAIEEVVADLIRDRAMDRLVCGDVGFGKTEVAIRAAYLVCLSGRQTMVLVPTTVLALQHLATFSARLEGFSARVKMLSRMTPRAEQRPILDELAAGTLDVLIGTHRLLGDDVRPRDLGLLIVDEEHRFGVRHKEKIKKLKTDVDVLTMTATPLPRTLQLSLTGLRDISVISTPPPGRRSIRTFIARFSKRVIAEAIGREISRGGQVFFVHNFIRSLPAMQRFLQRAVPEARIATAHGQMNERRLERVMTDFVRREIDVLLCTSIIESGLDIPTANTIIINRADRFGLAQLYQIRGRVGRSARRAFAYFMIPGLQSITPDSRKRLEALAEHAELGSGYRIASRDLEIRGAGNLLGKAQSGHIKALGFDLYRRLLERALMEVRGQTSREGKEPELNLPVPGFLPEDYVPQMDQRLDLYARLSRAADEQQVYDLEQEIVDRYGPTLAEVQNLIELTALKIHLRLARVLSLSVSAGRLDFRLDTGTGFDPAPLVRLVAEQSERATLDPDGWLRVRLDPEDRADPLPVARSVAARIVALLEPVPSS